MLTIYMPQSHFGLGLSSMADFSSTRARVLASVERAPCLPVRRAMRFRHTVWFRFMVIFLWLFFPHQLTPPLQMSSCSFLTELFNTGRWHMSFFHSVSGEACRLQKIRSIHLTSHSLCCFPWLLVIYACILFPGFAGSYSRLYYLCF